MLRRRHSHSRTVVCRASCWASTAGDVIQRSLESCQETVRIGGSGILSTVSLLPRTRPVGSMRISLVAKQSFFHIRIVIAEGEHRRCHVHMAPHLSVDFCCTRRPAVLSSRLRNADIPQSSVRCRRPRFQCHQRTPLLTFHLSIH